jgi:hypothetical protein
MNFLQAKTELTIENARAADYTGILLTAVTTHILKGINKALIDHQTIRHVEIISKFA